MMPYGSPVTTELFPAAGAPLPVLPVLLGGDTVVDERTEVAHDMAVATEVIPEIGGEPKTVATLAFGQSEPEVGPSGVGELIPIIEGNAALVALLAINPSLIAAIGRLVVIGIVDAFTVSGMIPINACGSTCEVKSCSD